MDNARERLMALLTEMFQLDQSDLDFGIFRVMNHKREEVSSFLRTELLPTIEQAFKTNIFADHARTREDIEKAKTAAFTAGFDASESPVVKKLLAQLQQMQDPQALEAEVCSDLVTFFSRYYESGDFISRRRYKDDVYAIPYQGEEVKLHWANHDQYYIKSSERLSRYAFTLPTTARRVRFEVVAGATEKDNAKATQERERRFVLADPAWEIDGAELVLRFAYRIQAGVTAAASAEGEDTAEEGADGAKKKAGPSQTECNDATVKAVRAGVKSLSDWAAELLATAPTEKRTERTVLERHLERFTKRNDFDYFIHKDLHGFLRRELDVFVKNEIFHLDDIERQGTLRVEQALSKVRVLRAVAHKLIDFLGQLEEFQKSLWLKKKFVYETSWCITLDRVPETLWGEVLANEAQRVAWVKLFAIDRIEKNLAQEGGAGALTTEFLRQNPSLVVDTALFSTDFTARLLASIDDLDASTTGVLIHGENFQALNLMQARYRGKVKCIYIDPPYNTGGRDFAYKDGYQHSSWLAMMYDRLSLAKSIQSQDGVILVSVDDAELHRVTDLLQSRYVGGEIAKLVWDRNRKNDARLVSVGHEYMLMYASDIDYLRSHKVTFREERPGLRQAKELFAMLRSQHADDWTAVRRGWREWFDGMSEDDPRRKLSRFSKVDSVRGPYRDDGDISWPGGGGPRYEVLHPITKKPCKIPARGWIYPSPDGLWKEFAAGRVVFGEDDATVPARRSVLFEHSEEAVMGSVNFSYAQIASQEFDSLMGGRLFDNAKNWRDIHRMIRYVGAEGTDIVDFFGGSGSTAHAVLALRRDGEKTRFLLVESASHFDTVLKPRILKVIHSSDWKDGVPVSRKGISAIVKVVRIESYEDALENLAPKRSPMQESLLTKATPAFREKYFLQYMLRWETRGQGSMVDGSAFEHPFDRALKVTQGDDVRAVTLDLVETFHWLIGLTVARMDLRGDVKTITGKLPTGESALVVWRDVDKVDIDALDAWWKASPWNADPALDVVYVNGAYGIETYRPAEAHWRAERTETVFLRCMFDADAS